MQKRFKFIEFSAGEFEGTVYNNIILSDGLRALKAKNATGKDKQFFSQFKEGQDVDCEIEITAGKNGAVVKVLSIDAVKTK